MVVVAHQNRGCERRTFADPFILPWKKFKFLAEMTLRNPDLVRKGVIDSMIRTLTFPATKLWGHWCIKWPSTSTTPTLCHSLPHICHFSGAIVILDLANVGSKMCVDEHDSPRQCNSASAIFPRRMETRTCADIYGQAGGSPP
jgi:hypothetical protein